MYSLFPKVIFLTFILLNMCIYDELNMLFSFWTELCAQTIIILNLDSIMIYLSSSRYFVKALSIELKR